MIPFFYAKKDGKMKKEKQMYDIILVGKSESTKWNNFVASWGTLLQSFEWGELKAKFGWQAYPLALVERAATANPEKIGEGDIKCVALILEKRLPLGRSFFYCPQGPVVGVPPWKFEEIKKYYNLILASVRELAKSKKAIFLRIDPPYTKQEFDLQTIRSLGFRKGFEEIQPDCTLKVDLSPREEEILAQMKPKGRYNIKVALKHKVKVEESSGLIGTKIFLEMHKKTAERDRFATHGAEYLSELIKMLSRKGWGSLFTARHEGQPLASILVSFFGKEAVYLYGASASEKRELMSTYLVQWEAMKKAKKRGLSRYDFWGIAPTDDPNHKWAGLRRFKMQFGGRQVDYIGSWDLVFRPVWYQIFKLAEKIRTKMARSK
jgi:lipid II:glycine glycyltransferase (peptidoglycan interpeptide bridge formation enzyme)